MVRDRAAQTARGETRARAVCMSPSLPCGLLSVIQMEMVLIAVSIIKAAGDAEPAGDAEQPAPASVRQRLHGSD